MIKISINTLLLILITIAMIVIAIVLIRISIQIKDHRIQAQQAIFFDLIRSNQSGNSIQPMIQSDFFRKSMLHAENVIKGNINADEYSKEGKQGSDIIRKFMYLNDDEKKSLLTSINYYQSDPIIYSEAEKKFRNISSSKMIPLWIAIIEDSMDKNIEKSDPSSVIKVVA